MKIVVVGAGIIGVTTAYELATRGHEVTLLDGRGGAGLETSYANGGHNPPLLFRSDGSNKLLGGHGMALGVLDEIEIESHEVRLRPGDVLVFYTDGITETLNEDEDEFGLERLRMVVGEVRQKNVQAIKETIIQAITDFAGDTPQFDDITLGVLKRG